MTDQANIERASAGPQIWVEFTGLGVFELKQDNREFDILLIDAQRAGIAPHHPVLMAPFESVTDPRTERPTVVTVGDRQVAIWDLTGRDLTFSTPPNAVAGVTFPAERGAGGSRPTTNGPDAWNDLWWLPDLQAVCGATAIAHRELVIASASFACGSMFVGTPPVDIIGLFRFEGVPAVPDRLYSDRGGCVSPIDADGVTLTLTSRKDSSTSSMIHLNPHGGGDLHVAIANYSEVESMGMVTEHFTAYYELVGSKTQPPIRLIMPNGLDAPSIRCMPPFLKTNTPA